MSKKPTFVPRPGLTFCKEWQQLRCAYDKRIGNCTGGEDASRRSDGTSGDVYKRQPISRVEGGLAATRLIFGIVEVVPKAAQHFDRVDPNLRKHLIDKARDE